MWCHRKRTHTHTTSNLTSLRIIVFAHCWNHTRPFDRQTNTQTFQIEDEMWEMGSVTEHQHDEKKEGKQTEKDSMQNGKWSHAHTCVFKIRSKFYRNDWIEHTHTHTYAHSKLNLFYCDARLKAFHIQHTTLCVRTIICLYSIHFYYFNATGRVKKKQQQRQRWWEEQAKADRSSTRCLWQACDSFDAQKTSSLLSRIKTMHLFVYPHVCVWESERCCLYTLYYVLCFALMPFSSNHIHAPFALDLICFAFHSINLVKLCCLCYWLTLFHLISDYKVPEPCKYEKFIDLINTGLSNCLNDFYDVH